MLEVGEEKTEVLEAEREAGSRGLVPQFSSM